MSNTRTVSRRKCAAYAVASAVYSAVDSDLSKRALEHLRKGEFKEIISLEIDPNRYCDVDSFRDDYLVVSLMSKFPSWDIGIDRQQVALGKFLEAETACSNFRKRKSALYGVASTTTSCASVFYTARRKIEACLGPFDWDEAELHFGWGPGASTQVNSRMSDAYYKFGVSSPEVTSNCFMLAACAIARVPAWYRQVAGLSGSDSYAQEGPSTICRYFTPVVGNKVVTVPKSAKTDRVIAIEPHMNMYVQRGIGGVIRQRLRRVGVDLNDQTANQRLAREGSLTGSLCTMDLSAASDTISLELVEELLPQDWVTAIKLCRSPVGTLPDGSQISYQKVSSMGNGFTFELESLIFWALVSSVVDLNPRETERRVSVYGDDLIFSSSLFHPVKEILAVAGFTVNDSKSFYYGYFRESCGKHYFDGHDVSPFYVRKDVDSPFRLLWACNEVWRYSSRRYNGLLNDSRFKACHERLVSMLPNWARRSKIPDGLGDMGLVCSFDDATPSRHRCLDGWVVQVWCPKPTKVRLDRRGTMENVGILKALSKACSPPWWEKCYFRGRDLPLVAAIRRNMSVLQGDLGSVGRVDTLLRTSDKASKNILLVQQWKGTFGWS